MVLIVAPRGEKFTLDVNPNATTLHQLKVTIQPFNGMPVSNQRLFLSQSLGQNDFDLISNLGIQPFSTLTLHRADHTTSSAVTNKEAKEKEELDRKRWEEFGKKLLPGYVEPEDDEDLKLLDASFQLTVKRCHAKTMKMMEAKMKLNAEARLKKMKEEQVKYQSLKMGQIKQIPKTYY